METMDIVRRKEKDEKRMASEMIVGNPGASSSLICGLAPRHDGEVLVWIMPGAFLGRDLGKVETGACCDVMLHGDAGEILVGQDGAIIPACRQALNPRQEKEDSSIEERVFMTEEQTCE